MATETILKTANYYYKVSDPGHYYKGIDGERTKDPIKKRVGTEYKNVYLSDLVDKKDCFVSFSGYRNTDDRDEPLKISTDVKIGIVKSYNPVSGLVAVDCVKKNPSSVSVFVGRTNKIRYVEPSTMMVSSITSGCLLNPIENSGSTHTHTSSMHASSSGGSYNPNYKKTLKRFRKLRKNRKSTRNQKRLRKHVRKNKRTLRYKKA